MLGLPHSIHLHTNMLGVPGNYELTVKTFDRGELDPKPSIGSRSQTIHITHVQFSSFGGDSWRTFESQAEAIAKYLNSHDHATVDLGQVVPGETTTMTADGPLEYFLHQINRLKWANRDVELETGGGLVPFIYAQRNLVNAVQWAIGLEVALLTEDPFKVVPSTEHPNAGPFTSYPQIIAWLMSREARDALMRQMHPEVARRSTIATVDREYDPYEVAILTRAGPAKILGISNRKGHLGAGADADIAIYDLGSEDPSPEDIRRAFSHAFCVIKGGEVIVKQGEVVKQVWGSRFWVNAKVGEDLERAMIRRFSKTFADYYTVTMQNFPVQLEYVPRSIRLQVESSLA